MKEGERTPRRENRERKRRERVFGEVEEEPERRRTRPSNIY